MDSRITAVLEYLKPHGFTARANIAPLLDILFPYPTENDEGIFNYQRDAMIRFLTELRNNEFITFNAYDLDYITNYRDYENIKNWFGKYAIVAAIKLNGLKYLANEDRAKKDSEVSNSIIKTNDSVQQTNKLVRDISKAQKNIAYISLGFIAISTIYLVATYYKDDSPVLKSISKQLQQQERLLDSMRKSQKGIDSSLRIMAKKTLPKKA